MICNVTSRCSTTDVYFQVKLKLEGTQRVQTHATSTFDLSTQNHVTCSISQGHYLYQVEHFGIIPFWVTVQTLVLTLTLTFQSKTIPFAGYPKVIPYIKFEHFGIIRFRVMPWTNKQTQKSYIVGLGNKTTK